MDKPEANYNTNTKLIQLNCFGYEVLRNAYSCFHLIIQEKKAAHNVCLCHVFHSILKSGQNLPSSFPIISFLEVWACHGHLFSLCVRWPGFIWGPSPPSGRMVLVGLSTSLLCHLLHLTQGWACDSGWAVLDLIEKFVLQAFVSFIVWEEPGCRMKPSAQQQSQETESWWYDLYFWTQACFPICI